MFSNLFDKVMENSGGVIKSIAKSIYYTLLLQGFVFVAVAIYCLFKYFDLSENVFLILVIVCIVAFIMSVIGALSSVALLYGFGDLIDSNKTIVDNTDVLINNFSEKKQKETCSKIQTEKAMVCAEYIDIECYYCYNKISVSKKTLLKNVTVVCPKCHNKVELSKYTDIQL